MKLLLSRFFNPSSIYIRMNNIMVVKILVYLQWRTKILGTVMKNLRSTSLTYQMFRCSIICTSLSTWIPQLALPCPPPSKQCWDEETLLGQGKEYRGAQTTTLLGGEVEKLRQIALIVLRILSSIVDPYEVTVLCT